MYSPLIERLIERFKGSPRIALLMSGKGSNAEVILRLRHRYPNLNFVAICTDRASSNALKLAKSFGLEYVCIEGKVRTQAEREGYFELLAKQLREYKIDATIYAGFMKISTASFVKEFPGFNVHPADLTLLGEDQKPKYVGMDVIGDAVRAGESYIASTAHIVDSEVDCGQPIMVSRPLKLTPQDRDQPEPTGRGLPLRDDLLELHEKLKVQCEHFLFPQVLELLSKGLIRTQDLPLRWKADHFFSESLIRSGGPMHPIDLAFRAQDDTSKVGFDFADIDSVFKKVLEEHEELSDAYLKRHDDWDHFVDEVGDCFFALTNLCRFIGLHPSEVIRRNLSKYLNRCKYIEDHLSESQQNWASLEPKEIKTLWERAKKNELK